MKKRNFLLEFALKSKYNLFASITALVVLLFAISTVTYAWIEGATTLTINDTTGSVYSNSVKAVNISVGSSAANNTLNLSQYLDPVLGSGKFYLAPNAVGSLTDNNRGLVNVKINGRDADTNDIGTNYIFFETKIKCVGVVTDLLFDTSSYIKIGGTSGATASNIKTGVTLLNVSDRTPVYSNIYTSEQIASGSNAVTGFAQDGEYILQFKIWNEGDNTYNPGSEISINFVLIPQKDTTTLKLMDYTNSETSQNLLSSKTVKVEYAGGSITGSKSGTTYTFSDVPCSQLDNIKFVAYDSSSDPVIYDLTGTSVEKGSTYTVYGDPTQSLGTFGNVQKVTLKDVSYENLLQSGTTVSIGNGVDSSAYTMYRGSSTTAFSAYVPVASIGKTITFSNTGYTVSGTLSSSNPYYYIFGETMTKSGTKTVCAGKWYASDSQTTTTIEIQDKTKGRLVQTNAQNVYVQYSDLGTDFYKAYYDTTNSRWKITATNNSIVVWSFEAYSDSAKMYNWTSEARKDADTCFYFLTAETTGASDGSWNYTGSDIDPGILTGEKVSFYGGIANNWTETTGVYISSTETTSATEAIAGTKKADGDFYQFSNLPSGKPDALTTFATAKFINVDSLNYYLKNKTDWKGKQIEENAQGGKFYGLWSTESGKDYIHPVDAVTGKTTIGSASEATSSASPANISTADASNLTLSTVTSSITSLLGENLYIEYHVSTDGTSYDCVKMMDTTNPISNTTTTTNGIDLSGYIDADATLIVKTVLTDGQVYYVSDTDYIRFADTKTVRLSPSEGATLSATYGGTTYTVAPTDTAQNITVYSGETLTVTATQTASTGKAKFTWSDSSSVGTQSPANTVLTKTSTYTLPIAAGSPSLTTLSVGVDQYYQLSYSGGITSTTATDTYVKSGKTVDLTFSHETNNYKVEWQVGTATVKTTNLLLAGETDTYTVTMDADKSVTVTLTQLYKLTYSLASGSASGSALTAKNGTTSLSSSPQYFENGTVISFTATKPDANNYYSITWKTTDNSGTSTSSDGDMKSESETKNITVNGNTTVEVTVTKSTTYAVTINKPINASLTAEYTVNGVTGTISEINTSGATVELPEGATVKVTATAHTGYQFDSYTVKNGNTTTTETDNPYTITVGTNTIEITVNTTEAAVIPTNAIFFKNTVGWSNVYVYFYQQKYWDASNGSGSNGIASGPTPMKPLSGTTDIYYLELPGDYSIVSFTKDSQSNYANFHKTEAVYRTDFNKSTPLYTPETTASGTYNTNVPYYNNGTWSAYPETTTEYTVTVTNNPNATITVKRNDTNATVASGDKVPKDTEITVTVTPNTNYNVKSITVGSSTLTYTTSGAQTLTATVTGNVTVSAVVEQASTTARTIYFDNTVSNWSNVYAHIWYKDGSSSEATSWPGNKMDSVAGNIYSITINDPNINYIIFNNNSDKQTGDVPIPTDGKDLFTWDGTTATYMGTWSVYSGGGSTSTLTVKISGPVLTEDNKVGTVKYCAVFKADGKSETSVTMDSQGSGKYTCTIPDGYTKVDIQRRSASDNKLWNEKTGLALPSGDCTYTINSWFDGSWS